MGHRFDGAKICRIVCLFSPPLHEPSPTSCSSCSSRILDIRNRSLLHVKPRHVRCVLCCIVMTFLRSQTPPRFVRLGEHKKKKSRKGKTTTQKEIVRAELLRLLYELRLSTFSLVSDLPIETIVFSSPFSWAPSIVEAPAPPSPFFHLPRDHFLSGQPVSPHRIFCWCVVFLRDLIIELLIGLIFCFDLPPSQTGSSSRVFPLFFGPIFFLHPCR